MVGGALLEGLQTLTPDRSANLVAASCGVVGRQRRLCLLSSSSEYGGGVPRPNLFLRKN